MARKTVGVLSLQGGVEEHIAMAQECGWNSVRVKVAGDLKGLNALILPGGESTTMNLLSRQRGLLNALKSAIKKGMPVFGTCAGAILLAKKVGKRKGLIGEMDLAVERNAHGRQAESFETDLEIKGVGKFHCIFIRAPVIREVGKNVEVLAGFGGKPALVRQGRMLAAAFHPELGEDRRLHKFFLGKVAQGF
ncbi:MAG: pyridoxal 5'-phosphate synthase glutaminase subunit PdxT [Candidatus Diapherotrites archaeon]|nr:pyridoxal 5'-phosphate synthase glutaminase subunit PdxT [Candidatus Diapherotrites archaeon]